ncbi:MAG TPA: hypothetical protein VF097_03950 [Actinomycetota bacterium]
MVASLGEIAEFLAGLAVGVLIGVVLAPLVGFWVRRHEWKEASRKARLTEDVLDLMDSMARR